MNKRQQSICFNKFLVFVLLLSVFCTGCSNNKGKDIAVISKKPCIVDIKETHTTVYKQPQYASTVDKNGILVEDRQKGKVKTDSITAYFKDYIKNEKWVELESLNNKAPYLKTMYTGKNIYMQTSKAFALRMTGSVYSDVKGVKLKNTYPKAEVLFGGWKTKNLLTPYSVSLLTGNKKSSLIKENNYINGIKCDLYSYEPNKSCNNYHCTYYKAEICYNKEYDMAINIKITGKTDINDKYYNVDKSINELTVTKLDFTDIPNAAFAKPKALILPDSLFNKFSNAAYK